MILNVPLIVVSPEQAHHLERMLHGESEKARRGHYPLAKSMVDLLLEVRKLAAVYRARVVGDASDADITTPGDVSPSRPTLDVHDLLSELLTGESITAHGVRAAARAGRLPGHRVNGHWVFDEVDALAWIAGRKNGRHDDDG